MKKLNRTGLAALLLAVSLGGYAVCMENVQAAGIDVEVETEDFSDEQELITEDQENSEDISPDLSDVQDDQELAVEEDPELPSFSDDENTETAQEPDENVNDINSTETEKSGFCGTEDSNVNWSLDEEGTLYITGEGAMASWESEADVPWAQYRSQIKEIQIEDGITSVGAYAFCNCSGLSTVTIG